MRAPAGSWRAWRAAALCALLAAAAGCGRFGLGGHEGEADADGDADGDADADADGDADGDGADDGADDGGDDGDPGTPDVVIVAVRSPVGEVARGEPGARVLVDVRNDGDGSAEDAVVRLSFRADGAYRPGFVPSEATPIALPPSGDRTVELSVGIEHDAALGPVEVDASVDAIHAGVAFSVVGAASTLGWTVLDRNTCRDPVELAERPAGSGIWAATVEDICAYAPSGDLEFCGVGDVGPDVVFSYTPPWDRNPLVSIEAGSLPVLGELRSLPDGCPGLVIGSCIDREGYFAMSGGVVHVIAVQNVSSSLCGPVTVTISGS